RVVPLDENALVRLDGPDADIRRNAVHLPGPVNSLARLQLAARPGKPKARRHRWVNKGLEHLLDRPADEHLRSHHGMNGHFRPHSCGKGKPDGSLTAKLSAVIFRPRLRRARPRP